MFFHICNMYYIYRAKCVVLTGCWPKYPQTVLIVSSDSMLFPRPINKLHVAMSHLHTVYVIFESMYLNCSEWFYMSFEYMYCVNMFREVSNTLHTICLYTDTVLVCLLFKLPQCLTSYRHQPTWQGHEWSQQHSCNFFGLFTYISYNHGRGSLPFTHFPQKFVVLNCSPLLESPTKLF